MITLTEADVLNALDDAACIFEQTPLRSDGLRDYRYVFVNAAFQRLFDMPDLVGLSLRDNFPGDQWLLKRIAAGIGKDMA